MSCKYHFDADAHRLCSSCGESLCIHCAVEIGGQAYCKDCLARKVDCNDSKTRLTLVRETKSKFLTFFFSFLPGAGHMYLGLINKGLMLMVFSLVSLFGTGLLSEILRIYWLDNYVIPPLLIISISYSVFDALATLDNVKRGKVVIDSEREELENIFRAVLGGRNFAGYALIAIGCLALINLFSDIINHTLYRYFNFAFSFSSIIMPIVLIIGGFMLIRKSVNS